MHDDGQVRVISGGASTQICCWRWDREDLAAPLRCEFALEGHTSRVSQLVVLNQAGGDESYDASYLASSSFDCTIRLWNLDQKRCIKARQLRHSCGPYMTHPITAA